MSDAQTNPPRSSNSQRGPSSRARPQKVASINSSGRCSCADGRPGRVRIELGALIKIHEDFAAAPFYAPELLSPSGDERVRQREARSTGHGVEQTHMLLLARRGRGGGDGGGGAVGLRGTPGCRGAQRYAPGQGWGQVGREP
jgi:hypothetical protein